MCSVVQEPGPFIQTLSGGRGNPRAAAPADPNLKAQADNPSAARLWYE